MPHHQRRVTVMMFCITTCFSPFGLQSEEPERVLLPVRHRAVSELMYERGRVLLLKRAPTSVPGPNDDAVVVLDKAGIETLAPAPSVALPEAKGINIRDVTVGQDEILIAVDEEGHDGKHRSLIVVYAERTRELARVIDTKPFVCMEIAVDSQGAIWCLGSDPELARPPSASWTLLQKFSRDGRLVGSFVTRSDIVPSAPAFPFFDTPRSASSLVSAGQYLYAWLAPIQTYVQLTHDGSIVRRVTTPPGGSTRRIIFGDDGSAVADLGPVEGSTPRLQRYHPITNTWDALMPDTTASLAPGVRLVGSDDQAFIFWDRGSHELLRRPRATNR